MLNLILTTDKISVITSSTAGIDVQVSGADVDNTTPSAQVFIPFKENTAITTATTTDISAVPAANHYKNLKFISLRNIHASTSNDVTVQFNANGTLYTLFKCTLLAGEVVVCREGVWFHYDVNGGVYATGVPNFSDTVLGIGVAASQADQETSTSTTTIVTPGRQHFHPSAAKCWVTAGVTGNILASYNITSLTDTGTGDIAVTIATDFSSALYAVAMAIQRINSTAAEANERIGTIKTASLAAGSFSMDCWDTTTTTNVIKDPTTWHAVGYGDL